MADTTDRTEKNRKLAQWLAPDGQYGDGDDWTRVPDFFTDESANALLLEKMRRSLFCSDWPGSEGWRVDLGVKYKDGPPIGPTCADRKEAVAEAAYIRVMSKSSDFADWMVSGER